MPIRDLHLPTYLPYLEWEHAFARNFFAPYDYFLPSRLSPPISAYTDDEKCDIQNVCYAKHIKVKDEDIIVDWPLPNPSEFAIRTRTTTVILRRP